MYKVSDDSLTLTHTCINLNKHILVRGLAYAHFFDHMGWSHFLVSEQQPK